MIMIHIIHICQQKGNIKLHLYEQQIMIHLNLFIKRRSGDGQMDSINVLVSLQKNECSNYSIERKLMLSYK